MKLTGFIEKDNRIVAVRVSDEHGNLSDLYLTDSVGLTNLECMQTEYLRGICFPDRQNHKTHQLITLDEIQSGNAVKRYPWTESVKISGIIKPVNYVEVDPDYFPRERELNMYDWLYNAPDKVLYVRGARQTAACITVSGSLPGKRNAG